MCRTWISDLGNSKSDSQRIIKFSGDIVTLKNRKMFRVVSTKIKTSKKLEIFKLGKEVKVHGIRF